MEDFEINSNENEKLEENKVKPEVNNNRNNSNNNNKYTWEKIGVELEKNKEENQDGETRNGHLGNSKDEGKMDVTQQYASSCRNNGELFRLDDAATNNDDDDVNTDDTQNNSGFSENGELVEEIIILPNNFISDDELSSNSDDCVYAYRGGHMNNIEGNLVHLDPVNLDDDGQEEETDFLEMDFDPEPNSEIENFIEDEHHFNHLEANFFSLRGEEGLRELPSVSQLRQNGSGSPLDSFANSSVSNQVLQNQESQSSKSSDIVYTGAKPKLVTSGSAQKLSSTSSASYSKDQFDCETNRQESTSYKPSSAPLPSTSSNTIDESCLECAEAELLFQTKPESSVERKCRRHRNKEVPSLSSYSSPDHLTTSNNLHNNATIPVPSNKSSQVSSKSSSHPINPCSNKEFMVTIYSINCDYETIVEATNLIGVIINPEILQHYFDNLADEETATMSVPEYLLYVSKRNCNYKRLIDVIKAACLSPVDIHFYPHDPCNSATPDIVQISTSEITQRWNRNMDLRQILKFKNKNFKSLNVLGKVVSAIRQYESGDRLKITNSVINIPQYYRSGYICITKLASSVSN